MAASTAVVVGSAATRTAKTRPSMPDIGSAGRSDRRRCGCLRRCDLQGVGGRRVCGRGERRDSIGHSLAGTLLPRVTLKRKIGGLIYLCPAIPPRDRAEHEENLAAFGIGMTNRFHVDDKGIVTMTEDDAIFTFYHDAPPEIARWAAAQLRPQWAGAMSTSYASLDALPKVPSRAVICADDRVLQLDKTRRLIQQRLHTDPIEFPGGHSPFLSQPAKLAAMLDHIVQDLAQP